MFQSIDSLTYTRELLKHGVGVFFLTDNICTIEQDSELRLTIMSSIAQDEVRKLSERVKFGHRKAIERGHVLGNSRIFGYDLVGTKLVINEHEAEMVQLIFETYATGEYGLRYIEDLLWDKGYCNRNGKKIHHNTLSGIITNPKYKGYFCGNKVKIVDYRTKEQKFLPESEWIMYKDESGETVPAIVSEELWEKANAVFIERSQKVKATDRSAKKTSPLSGKIICGYHNEPFWRSSYSKRIHPNDPIYEWICRTKKKGKAHDCPTVAVYESELYDILGKLILELPKNIDSYVDEFIQIYQSSIIGDTSSKRIKELTAELTSLEKKKENLLDLYTDEIITKTEFKERNQSLNSTIADIKDKLSEVRKQSETNGTFLKDIAYIRNLIKSYEFFEGSLAREQINDVCETLIDSITVYPIDKSTMKIQIKLKTGNIVDKDYDFSYRVRASWLRECCQNAVRENNNNINLLNVNLVGIEQFKIISNRIQLKNQPTTVIVYEINICL